MTTKTSIKRPLLMEKEKSNQTSKKCTNWLSVITYVTLILIIILSAVKMWLICYQYENAIDKNAYQVVFLNNGESYFGKLRNIGFKSYELTDVYYIKYSTKNQQAETQSATTNDTGTDNVNVNNANNENFELKLIELGSEEFYKPTNKMIINKDNILYWENLQKDSQVADFINKQK